MKLATFVATVYLPSRIEVSTQYAAFLARVVRHFSAFLGRPAELPDLSERSICAYLTAYRQRWSARAANNQRQVFLSLWRDAADNPQYIGLLVELPNPRRIRKLPEEVNPPEAWTSQQVRQLMDEATYQRGVIAGVLAGDWWLSLLLSIYWTSCRVSSIRVCPTTAYDGCGLLVRRQKNHRPQWFPLPETCREAIERTRPAGRQLLWPWPWHPRTLWDKMRRIVEAAGLPAPKTGRQLFHRLRRTTITLCASIDPAVAQRTAGHQSYSTTLKHYVDPRLLTSRSAADILPDPLPSIPRLRIVS